ncbi:MAG: endopeptidase La [Microthrixaceae bacterium]
MNDTDNPNADNANTGNRNTDDPSNPNTDGIDLIAADGHGSEPGTPNESGAGHATLPVLTLTSGVVLPQMVLTVALETEEATAAVEAALTAEQSDGSGLVLLVPRIGDAHASVGTIANIDQAGELPGGMRGVFLRGLRRARLGAAVAGTGDALWVEAHEIETPVVTSTDEELAREYRAVLEAILEHRRVPQIAEFVRSVDGAEALADISGYSPDVSLEHKVELLETLDLTERLRKVLAWARDTLADLELKAKVRSEVSDNLEQRQREVILREQLAAIRKELGDDDAGGIDDYRSAVAERALPEEVERELTAEIEKLERTPEQAAEHGWIRTWIDTVLALPWGVKVEENLDLSAAQSQLDADHTGLDDVKERLIEFLAVRKLRLERASAADAARPESGDGALSTHDRDATHLPEAQANEPSPKDARSGSKGAILALVGPPGVGKTSLGRSVAEALGRPYVRVALGGVRDESEIRGHRRTYVGARPGRIAKAIEQAGAMNPVMVLDEIDKVGSDWRGDPSSALLEVLDPAQNSTFRDHYLELDLDLSDVVFVATANVLDTIPAPLLDRMEIIQLHGYTTDEKVAIARDHLMGRQLVENGLEVEEVRISEDAITALIEGHTHEPGVRGLERKLGAVLRKIAAKVASGRAAVDDAPDEAGDGADGQTVRVPVEVEPETVRELLGRPRHRIDTDRPKGVPGVATGLAVTGVGGDVLLVEAARVDALDERTTQASGAPQQPTTGALELTGQLGDVMVESGRIALSYLRANPDVLTSRVTRSDSTGQLQAIRDGRFHVHFPAGAVPKDGPSAGVTMTTAMVSLLTDRPMRPEVAMTGEVSLTGRVLPIGGVKQKLLAAHRDGLSEVIIPADNEADLDDVPDHVLEDIEVHLASRVEEVLDLALA